MKLISIFSLSILILFIACQEKNETPTIIDEGNDPNFKIVANNDGVLNSFNRKVVVFDIEIYAVPKVSDEKLLHAANIMAQYLDNDENGTPDNQLVMDKMVENQAFMVMWNSENDLNISNVPSDFGQDLGNDETNPNYVSSGLSGRFDASLEEVLHIITHSGYAQVYPDIFGENAGTSIANAMDIARGGHFQTIPNPYPSEAWYSYDDSTCEYNCMVTEYHYWALTSILGAQANRLDEIGHEWKLNTKEKVEQTDVAVYELLTDSQYGFPMVLPDGTYRR